MEAQRTFCEECRRDVEYRLERYRAKETLRGEEYYYPAKRAACAECGSEVYVAAIADENLQSFRDAYRRQNGLISVEGITEILRKYDIGKRPLSKLLGWGEMTLSRYLDGDMPTRQYSDVLQQINRDVGYYISLLEQYRDRLTDAAYRKSRRACEKLLGGHTGDQSKLDAVIAYILSQCEETTPLALQRMLYYAQGFFYAFAGSFLFDQDCEAWVHGPVYPVVYHRYSHLGYAPIEEHDATGVVNLTEMEKAILDSVIRNFGCYSGKILERFTHSETPWLETRGDLPAEAPSNRKIDKDTIGRYFTAVKEKYQMLTPGDIESYARAMFERARGTSRLP